MNKLRWGILSTANIATRNWKALRLSGNSVITAVASRDVERSRRFIKNCQAEAPFATPPVALGSYEALIRSPHVDAVYIPLPTGLRKEWVLRAAAAGKHVVCEKPCGLNAADVGEMIAACRKHRVQFMDGVMFMHNPRLERARKLLDDAAGLGEFKRIESMFTFRAVDEFFGANIRVHSELEPTGCLGDLGWYCIRFSLWAMNWRLPREVTGRILSQRGNRLSPAPAPTDFSGELIFNDDISAGFFCSFLVQNRQWAEVSGTKGHLRLPDFVHPFNDHEPVIELRGREVRVKCCTCKSKHTTSRERAQDANLFRNFVNQVRTGKLNSAWPMWALKTQQVMDACYQSAKKGGRPVKLKGSSQ
jgi:predicted dehydrogenase